MTGIITDIKYQKRDMNQVSIFIDGKYAFSVTLLKAAGFTVGDKINETEINDLKNEYEKRMAYHQAIRFLSRSPRSTEEVRAYLQQKGCAKDLSQEAVLLLEKNKYINDTEFARIFVENRERFSPRSRFALGTELRQKGIDNEIINSILSRIDDRRSAWNAVESKIFRWKDLPGDKFKMKLLGFLSRRGFNYEISQEIFEKALQVLRSFPENDTL